MCTVVRNAARKPELDFRLHPTDSSQPDAHPARESVLGLELVDHRASEAGDFADLRQTKNLDFCHRHQDYPSRIGVREARNGGEILNYLPNTQTTDAAGVGF